LPGKGLIRTQHFGTVRSDEEVERLQKTSDICWDEHVGEVELMLARHLQQYSD
jgi:hypothetical protein